jgi:hypothetical protein
MWGALRVAAILVLAPAAALAQSAAPPTLFVEQTNFPNGAGTADLSGTAGPDAEVQIHASTFPYRSDEVIKTLRTSGSDNSFETSDYPRQNTVYWATSGGLASRRVVVFVDFYSKATIYGRGSSRRLTMRVWGPSGAPLPGRRVYVYLYRAKQRRAVRLAMRRLKAHVGPSAIRAEARVRVRVLPAPRRDDHFFYCLEEKHDDGFGKPEPSDADCGKRIIR